MTEQKFFWPYNYGTCKNLHNFFGDSKWHWLMPVRAEASLSGGLHFVEVDQGINVGEMRCRVIVLSTSFSHVNRWRNERAV